MEPDNDKPLDINLDFSDPSAPQPASLDPSLDPSLDFPLSGELQNPSDGALPLEAPLADFASQNQSDFAGNLEGGFGGDPFAEQNLNPLAPDEALENNPSSSTDPTSFDEAPLEVHPSAPPSEVLQSPTPHSMLSSDPVLPPELPPLTVPSSSVDSSSEPNPKTIQNLKSFSENLPYEKVNIPASLPFSLLIEGELTATEKEKLVDLLNREDMGVREVDLEPQFENHRVLIPRISEFAGVLLVQALKTARVQMRLGPADEIFSSDPSDEALTRPQSISSSHFYSGEISHPAESIPVTSEEYLPKLTDFEVIDTLVASAGLESSLIEAQKSEKYTEVLEALKKELQYKAHRKGATAIVKLNIHLQSLSLPTQYRLTLTGLAIKPS